jgi:polyferredoxin
MLLNPPYPGTAKSHFARAGLRVLVYSIAALVLNMHDIYFANFETANLAWFMLFSTVFELLFVPTGSSSRRWCYVACLVGLFLSGGFLVREAAHMEQATKDAKCHQQAHDPAK